MENTEDYKNSLWHDFEACASVENYLKYKNATQQKQEENENANYHNGDSFKRS